MKCGDPTHAPFDHVKYSFPSVLPTQSLLWFLSDAPIPISSSFRSDKMVRIAPFEVEAWMDKHETTAKYNIAETCAASISVDDLVTLSENKAKTTENLSLTSRKLTYGEIRGSDALRTNLAGLYSARAAGTTKDDILITPRRYCCQSLGFLLSNIAR